LRVGDEIVVLDGTTKPLKWIGRMSYRKETMERWARRVVPVRIAPAAMAPDVPQRQVYLSQEHSVYDGQFLIPANYLVNNHSISREAPVDINQLDYFHLEFAEHQVFLAEGLPVESLQDRDLRRNFDNFDEYRALYGDDGGGWLQPFAPVLRRWRRSDKAVALLRIGITALGVDVRDHVQRVASKLKERALALEHADQI